MTEVLSKRGLNIMTVTIAIVCSDGVVIGADRKVTMSRGTRIKSLEQKIYTLSFRDGKKLLICGAGSTDQVRRAMFEINPVTLDTMDCNAYRDMVESTIARLRWKLSERNLIYDATLLFGMIDAHKPVIGHITSSGLVELKYEGYFTEGIAAPYAEIVLKDSYSKDMSVDDAKLIVGGLIEKIGKVDNDVEGMDVFYMASTDERIDGLTWEERQAVISEDSFSFDFKRNLENVKSNIEYWKNLLKKPEKEEQHKEPEQPTEPTEQ